MASTTLARAARRSRRGRARTAPIQRRDPLLIVAAVLGLLVSAYLALVDLAGGTTLCLAGSDCDVVRASAYGRLAGLPVATLGAAYFLAVLGAAVAPASWLRPLLQALGGVGVGAAAIFLALQSLLLGAWCPYCLVADLAALAIGVRVFWPRGSGLPAGSLRRGIAGAALAVAVLILGYAVSPTATAATSVGAVGAVPSTSTLSPERLAALADHLRDSGADFYGAYWCPHCQAQKEMFGEAASRLPYVECDPRGAGARSDLCQAAGVRAYPTWIVGGRKIEGEISPMDLALLSGFEG